MFEGLSGEALSKAIQREFGRFDTDGTGLLDRYCGFCSPPSVKSLKAFSKVKQVWLKSLETLNQPGTREE